MSIKWHAAHLSKHTDNEVEGGKIPSCPPPTPVHQRNVCTGSSVWWSGREERRRVRYPLWLSVPAASHLHSPHWASYWIISRRMMRSSHHLGRYQPLLDHHESVGVLNFKEGVPVEGANFPNVWNMISPGQQRFIVRQRRPRPPLRSKTSEKVLPI